MISLTEEFSTDNVRVAYLVPGVGLGRLMSILFFDVPSDRLGCWAVILLGAILYILFFFGIPAGLNLVIALTLTACAGVANSALDTGRYPALMECFLEAFDSAIILIKTAVSLGQMTYSVVVNTALFNHIQYGHAVIIPGVLFVVITLMLLKSRLPSQMVDAGIAEDLPQTSSKPLVWLEGTASVISGVAVFSTSYIIAVWMSKYAMAFAGMVESDALKTISYHGMGSLVCIFIFAALLKKWARPIWANALSVRLATITVAVTYLYPSPLVCNAGSFLIGSFAAGDILQLGVSAVLKFFPKSKVKITGIHMMMGGVVNFIIPLITGYLSNASLQYIILLDLIFAPLASVTIVIAFIRCYRALDIPRDDVWLDERYFQ